MRRATFRAHSRSGSEPESPFWISYSDLMTSLSILLILMVSAFLLQEQQKNSGMEEMIQVKRSVIEQLLSQLSKNFPVKVDPKTGAIAISNRILFDSDDSTIKPEGKSFLKKFIPIYSGILLGQSSTKKHISQIQFIGFADRNGSYEHNLELSLNRSRAVSEFIFADTPNFPHKEALREVLSTNGRSFMEPKESMALSRRVEIRFLMKDWDTVFTTQKAVPPSSTPSAHD